VKRKGRCQQWHWDYRAKGVIKMTIKETIEDKVEGKQRPLDVARMAQIFGYMCGEMKDLAESSTAYNKEKAKAYVRDTIKLPKSITEPAYKREAGILDEEKPDCYDRVPSPEKKKDIWELSMYN
jgi:hypothetical protein